MGEAHKEFHRVLIAKTQLLASSKRILTQQLAKLQGNTHNALFQEEIDALTTLSEKTQKLSSFVEVMVKPVEDLDAISEIAKALAVTKRLTPCFKKAYATYALRLRLKS